MFWDGERWIDDRRPARQPNAARNDRLRSRLATLPVLLMIPALLLPAVSASASTPATSRSSAHLAAMSPETLTAATQPVSSSRRRPKPSSTPTATPAPTATPVATPGPTQAPTPIPTAVPTPTPTAVSTAVPTPAPTSTPAPGINSVRATSISELLADLADNTVDEIVVANGTYPISPSHSQAGNSLWIGSRFAGRTRPVTVRAETAGGVTLDGGGANMGCISFEEGAHDETWDGFRCANGLTNQTGAIMFGGYAGRSAPHDITLRNFTVAKSIHRAAAGSTTDHAVYFSYGLDTWGNILIEDLTVDASDPMGLASAIHMDHGYPSDAPNVAAHDVTVRRLTYLGNKLTAPTEPTVQYGIILWTPPVHDWLFDGATINNASGNAARFESSPAANVVFKDITSTNSRGFSSSLGTNPPGVTFSNDTWH